MNETSHRLIIESAQRTIAMQADAVKALSAFAGPELIKAVEVISNCRGRLVVSGIGKSAIVAQKIVATMNSTGTPALFMHAADAIHGDLGMIQQDDIVMVVSKSGDSPEIKVLSPLVKNFGNVLIGLVGNMQSYLASHADIILNTTVEQEACPNNLAPTTSTTAQIVMGDALAICLMEAKGFNASDFARFHPGGLLGKKLYLRVGDLIKQHEIPAVQTTDNIRLAIVEISEKRLGATVVLDEALSVSGIVTDGDVRRMFEKFEDFRDVKAKDIMTINPKSIEADLLAIEALETLRRHNITQLIVTEKSKYIGILHLHDLLREGII